MFLRVVGRQCLVLSSYRDGYGKVCQRQLGSFRNRESLEQCWRELGEEPKFRGELKRLREKAESLLPSLVSTDSGRKAKQAVRALLHILASEPESVSQEDLDLLRRRLQLEPPEDGRQKVEWERSRLSPRRRRLGPQSSFAQALENWAQELEEQGQSEEALRAREELAERIPGEMGQLEYAAGLQRAGQPERAIEVLTALSAQNAWRNFGLASLYWQRGQADRCLEFVLKGLARDGQVAKVLDCQKRGKKPASNTREGQEYWTRFGDLWDDAGRRFLLCVAQQPVVRAQRARRPQVDKLVSPISLGHLLEKALQASQADGKEP